MLGLPVATSIGFVVAMDKPTKDNVRHFDEI